LKKKAIYLVLTCLAATALILGACKGESPATTTSSQPTQTKTTAPPATQTTKLEEKPRYGGILNLVQVQDITVFDDIVTVVFAPGPTQRLTYDTLWQGDWVKGDAGGYGTGESPWTDWWDKFEDKAGMAATSWKWTLDAESKTGTIVYEIRQGVKFGLDPDSEASRLVNGRLEKMSIRTK
jgi:hypothetical protein